MYLHLFDATDDNIRMIEVPTTSGAASVIYTYTVSGLNDCYGMAFDGTHIHLSDRVDRNIRTILPPRANGVAEAVRTYTVTGSTDIRGVAFDGTHIHVVDQNGNIRMILPPTVNGAVTPVYTYTVSGASGNPRGITFDGTHIHIAYGTRFYMILPPTANSAVTPVYNYTVDIVGDAAGMTFDGTHIHVQHLRFNRPTVFGMILPPSSSGAKTAVYTYTISGIDFLQGMTFDGSIVSSATLTISTDDRDIRPGEPVNFKIASDIDITGFAASDVTVTGGTRGTLTRTDAKNYTLAVTAGSAGKLTLAIGKDAVSPGNAAVSQEFTINARISATVAINKTTFKNSETATVTVSLSETPDANLSSGSLTASAGTLTGFTGSGRTYTATLTAPASGAGTITVALAANAVSAGGIGNARVTKSISYTAAALPAPSVPTLSSAIAVDHDTIRLTHTLSTGTVTQYQYRVATSEAGLASATWVNGGTGTTIDVGNLSSNTRYYFQVRARNADAASAASNTVNATTAAAPEIAGTYYFIQSGGQGIAYDFDKNNATTRNSAKDRNFRTLVSGSDIRSATLADTPNGRRIGIIDNGSPRAIRVLNEDFSRDSTMDVTLRLSAGIYTALCAIPDGWVCSVWDSGTWRLEFYSWAGVEDTAKRQAPTNRGNNGLFADDTYIYIVSNIDDAVYRRTFDAATITSFISALGTGGWNGGSATSDRFILVDSSGNKGVFYNHSGALQSSEEISLPNAGYDSVLAVEEVEEPVLVAPGTPGTLSATAVDHDTIRLSFGASTGTVTQYQYRYATTSGGLSSATWRNGGTGTTIDVDGLSASTQYYFQVRAANQSVYSAATASATATTQAAPIVAPSAPASLSAIAVDHDTIRLTIGASTGTVTQRQYRYATSEAGLASATWQNAATATIDVDGLSPSTTYYFQARAGNQGRWSAASTTTSATTAAPPPVAPTAPSIASVTAIDHKSVRIVITPGTGTTTQFQVRYATSRSGLASASWANAGTSTMIVVSGLSPSTTYYFQVRAGNQSAYSAASTDSSATTAAPATLVPVITKLQPQAILVSTDFDIQIPISNSPTSVAMTGSLNESGYHYDKATGILHFRGNIEKLLNNQTALITASNAAGAAVPVEFVYAIVPPAPIIEAMGPFMITRGRFFDLLIPVQNVRSADVEGLLTYLDQETLAEQHAIRIFGTIPTSADFTTMRGTWRITADHPVSPVVGTVDFFIQDADFVFTPDAPTGVKADGNIGGGAIRLRWDAVTGISRYEYRVGTGEWIYAGNVLTVDITGLPNGVTQNLYVRSVDGHGVPSAASAVVKAFPIGVPSGVRDLQASPGDKQIRIVWQAPADIGGSAITHYEVRRGESGSWTNVGRVTSYTATGLSNDVPVTLYVRAVNATGNGAEVSVTATPILLVAPSGTITITLTPGSNRITVSWNHPSNRGTPPAVYDLYRSTDPRVSLQSQIASGLTGTTYTDTAVSRGTTYYYTIVCRNAAGTIVPETKSATPL